MIAIAQEHGIEIAFPPFLEIEVVVVGVFLRSPTWLSNASSITNIPMAVAGIEKSGGWRIVAAADGIKSV